MDPCRDGDSFAFDSPANQVKPSGPQTIKDHGNQTSKCDPGPDGYAERRV